MAKRILIVEDSPDIQNILKMTLEFEGYEVSTANNGLEGIECVKSSEPFDLIFSDLDMPVMNGIEFIRRYRAEREDGAPILVLTAEIGQVVGDALGAGANGTIKKPFEPMQLLDEVGKFLAD